MINPLRSEEDAFRFTLIALALLAPIAIVAVIFGTGAGLAVAGGLVLGLVIGLFVLRRDEPRQKAALRDRPRRPDMRRVLVVANETLSGRALREEISLHGDTAHTELRVVTPALNSKIRHWTNEEGDARAAARDRLDKLLGTLRAEGFQADGEIGDDDPVQAME